MDREADGRGRILVVEDDPVSVAYVLHVLRNRGGFTVTHAADPKDALRQATAARWDLVLTDVEMPGMTGIELLGQLRERAPLLPVAVLTAHPSVDYAVQALRNSADEFLEKQVEPDRLVAVVAGLVARGRAAREASRQSVLAIGAHPDDVEIGAAGIELMLAPARALDLTLDKLALASCCAGQVLVPRTEPFDAALDAESWDYPVVVKPRTGSGSRDISIVVCSQELAGLDRPADFIVQEYLPGEEYSIDVLADAAGHVVASVPRVRARVDSGVSVAGRPMHDLGLEHFGAAVATATGLTYIANVQARRDAAGRPALLEVNPRAPGALPLTMASGVDMPRLALDSLRGYPVPRHLDFQETAMVRFLDERFVDLSEVQKLAA